MFGGVPPGFRKRIQVRVFIIIMFAYSARKNSANGPAAYSTLNPETSSDSPSVRSNGARFVSAKVEMNHIMARGQEHSSIQWEFCVIDSICIVNPPVRMMVVNRMIPRVTSYEMVCATARRAPIRGYFEFEAHPDQRIEYTAMLDRASINNNPRLRSVMEIGIGRGAQIIRARNRARVGVIINSVGEEGEGRTGSLVKSFTPSATGWSRP